MKKPLLLVAIVGFAAVIFLATRDSKTKPVNLLPPVAKAAEASKERSSNATNERVASALPKREYVANPADTLEIAALRKALSAENHDGLQAACDALKAYIEAHPERVSEFIEFMRSEKDEHVLRQFALVLAGTEVGLLENEEIIKTAIELAKDSAFEQRQHIMLHLMADFPQMRDDVLAAILSITQSDPNPQVKTSGVVTLADLTERFPDHASALLGEIWQISKTAKDQEVLLFTYQMLALHKEQLTPDMFSMLGDRFKNESDPFAGNLIACALFAAPEGVRNQALQHAQAAFDAAVDPQGKRDRLFDLVCISQGKQIPLLERLSPGDSLINADAREYRVVVNGPFEPQDLLGIKASHDGNHASCSHPEHQNN